MKKLFNQIKQRCAIGAGLSLVAFLLVGSASLWEVNATPIECGADSNTRPANGIGGVFCLRDNASGSILTYDGSGCYTFMTCKGFTLSGKGTITAVNNIEMLSDRKPDRSVAAGFNKGQLTGSAAISFMIGPGSYQTFRINDTTSQGKVCSCPTG